MTNSSLEFAEKEATDFTNEQKIKLMQFAVVDEDFVERCNTVQAEMKSIEIE
ncbi:MAG: hypothetical protein IJX10_05080 [Phascolarctobacterium sp.]|nr:hypothetical protein [Phascolarctobacterium sp.]